MLAFSTKGIGKDSTILKDATERVLGICRECVPCYSATRQGMDGQWAHVGSVRLVLWLLEQWERQQWENSVAMGD